MKSNNNKKPVKLDDRVKQVGGTLIIKEARVDDSGKYLCMVNNSVGGESVETVLTVTGFCNAVALVPCIDGLQLHKHEFPTIYVTTLLLPRHCDDAAPEVDIICSSLLQLIANNFQQYKFLPPLRKN
jgi:hypothetical protein